MFGIYESGTIIAEFVAPMSIRSNHPVFSSDTLSLSRLISRRTAQRWEIETRLEPLSSNAQELFVHMVTKGSSSSFSIYTPQNYGVVLSKTSNSTPTVTQTTVGSSFVNVTLNTNTGFIPKGTFIKFSNHSKVYMTTTDLTNSPGGSTIGIYPPLRTALTASPVCTFTSNDVVMTCLYDLDVMQGMTFVDGIIQDMGSIRMVEAI